MVSSISVAPPSVCARDTSSLPLESAGRSVMTNPAVASPTMSAAASQWSATLVFDQRSRMAASLEQAGQEERLRDPEPGAEGHRDDRAHLVGTAREHM